MLTNHQRIRGLNLDKSHISIDGKPLSDYAVFAVAGGITIGDAKPVTMFQSAPGRSGGWDVTLDDAHGYPALERREISIQIAATGDHMEIGEAKTLVGGHNRHSVRVGGLTDYGELRGRLSVGAWEDQYDAAGTLKHMHTHVERRPLRLRKRAAHRPAIGRQDHSRADPRQPAHIPGIAPVD